LRARADSLGLRHPVTSVLEQAQLIARLRWDPKQIAPQLGRRGRQSEVTQRTIEPRSDQIGPNALPRHTRPETRVVVATTMHIAQFRHHPTNPVGSRLSQPIAPQIGHLAGQAQWDGTCRDGTGIAGRAQDGFKLMVGQPGHKGRYADPHGAPCLSKGFERFQASFGRWASRLHLAGKIGIECRDRNRALGNPGLPHLPKQIGIALDQTAFGDDADRMAELGQDLKQAAHDPVVAFNRLIRVGIGANRNHLRTIGRSSQFTDKNRRRIWSCDQSRFEIQTRRQAQIGMRGPRETVDAAMFAPTIRVDRAVKSDVGRSIPGNDAARPLDANLGPQRRQIFGLVPPTIINRPAVVPFKPASGIAGCTAPTQATTGMGRIKDHSAKIEHNGNIGKNGSRPTSPMSQTNRRGIPL